MELVIALGKKAVMDAKHVRIAQKLGLDAESQLALTW